MAEVVLLLDEAPLLQQSSCGNKSSWSPRTLCQEMSSSRSFMLLWLVLLRGALPPLRASLNLSLSLPLAAFAAVPVDLAAEDRSDPDAVRPSGEPGLLLERPGGAIVGKTEAAQRMMMSPALHATVMPLLQWIESPFGPELAARNLLAARNSMPTEPLTLKPLRERFVDDLCSASLRRRRVRSLSACRVDASPKLQAATDRPFPLTSCAHFCYLTWSFRYSSTHRRCLTVLLLQEYSWSGRSSTLE